MIFKKNFFFNFGHDCSNARCPYLHPPQPSLSNPPPCPPTSCRSHNEKQIEGGGGWPRSWKTFLPVPSTSTPKSGNKSSHLRQLSVPSPPDGRPPRTLVPSDPLRRVPLVGRQGHRPHRPRQTSSPSPRLSSLIFFCVRVSRLRMLDNSVLHLAQACVTK